MILKLLIEVSHCNIMLCEPTQLEVQRLILPCLPSPQCSGDVLSSDYLDLVGFTRNKRALVYFRKVNVEAPGWSDLHHWKFTWPD